MIIIIKNNVNINYVIRSITIFQDVKVFNNMEWQNINV